MSDIYPYADENRILHPLSYMYPPLHGELFFAAYKESRCAAMNIFTNRCAVNEKIELPLEIVGSITDACRVREEETLIPPLSLRTTLLGMICGTQNGNFSLPLYASIQQNITIQTEDMLDFLLKNFPAVSNDTYSWINFFLGRFEITKRLYEGYTFPSRKGEGKFDNHTLYVKLALFLGSACFQAEDVRYLNALLKLNDLLCSIAKELHGKNIVMASCAVTLEAACAARLLKRIQAHNASS